MVSNTGVVATDTTGVGTGRYQPGSTEYGYDKGVVAWGVSAAGQSLLYNRISNTGVATTDYSSTGTARTASEGAGYG